MKKLLACFLALSMLLSSAMADGWLTVPLHPDAVQDGTTSIAYDAASSVGNVTNMSDPGGNFDM